MKKPIANKEILLWLLKIGGITCLSTLDPKLPTKLLKGYLKNKNRLKERLKRLEARKWIKISEVGDQIKLELVEDGIKKAYYYQLENLKIKKSEKWDGLWRVVIFDVPEEKKVARDVLRNKLKELGFVQLQKSVFVLPYPCKKEIDIIRETYKIWPHVTYMLVKEIDLQEKLVNHFNL
ncbi:MAG: hypothetical protein ACD_58C00039G0006 [uncultured bacterium]|nr:MAG: hypothetical protein ACD_58C00039G0006 [uncultured bacterium]